MATNQSLMAKVGGALRRFDDSIGFSAKSIFFSMAMTIYSFHVFRGPFIKKDLGFTDLSYGQLAAAMAAVSFPSIGLWSTLADYTGRHRAVLCLISVAAAASFDAITFIPRDALLGDKGFGWKMLASVLLCAYAMLISGLIPLVDYLSLRLLSSKPGFNKEMYGRQRAWATIGYPVISLGVGQVVERLGGRSLFWIVPAMTVPFLLSMLAFGPSDTPKTWAQIRRRLRAETSRESVTNEQTENEEEQAETAAQTKQNDVERPSLVRSNGSLSQSASSENLLINDDQKTANTSSSQVNLTGESANATDAAVKKRSPWAILLTNPVFLFFLFAVFMNGLARAVMTIFAANVWKEDYKMKDSQVGYATVWGVALEIVIFYFGGPLGNLFGNYWMLILAQAAMALRCWLYWILPTGPGLSFQVYGVELLKGVAFGFTHTAGVKLALEAAPKGLEATAQALYSASYAQLPQVIAACVGGAVKQMHGSKLLFLGIASLSTLGLVLVFVRYLWEGRLFNTTRHVSSQETNTNATTSEQQAIAIASKVKELVAQESISDDSNAPKAILASSKRKN